MSLSLPFAQFFLSVKNTSASDDKVHVASPGCFSLSTQDTLNVNPCHLIMIKAELLEIKNLQCTCGCIFYLAELSSIEWVGEKLQTFDISFKVPEKETNERNASKALTFPPLSFWISP